MTLYLNLAEPLKQHLDMLLEALTIANGEQFHSCAYNQEGRVDINEDNFKGEPISMEVISSALAELTGIHIDFETRGGISTIITFSPSARTQDILGEAKAKAKAQAKNKDKEAENEREEGAKAKTEDEAEKGPVEGMQSRV